MAEVDVGVDEHGTLRGAEVVVLVRVSVQKGGIYLGSAD